MKLKLLDLFCGAGGCSTGYSRAGFEVTGVDIVPRKRYPFAFIQADALENLAAHGHEYDVIAASPPCQAHSAMKTMPNAKDHIDLIPQTRELLIASGKLWIMENVPGAPLRDPVILCGSMFGLRTDDGAQLRRHRLFETNWNFSQLDVAAAGLFCRHTSAPTISVCGNGGGARLRVLMPECSRLLIVRLQWGLTG